LIGKYDVTVPPLSPSELLLSPDVSGAEAYLASLGFRDPIGAIRNLEAIVTDPALRQGLGALADPLLAALQSAPDPDSALVNFSRYVAARPDRATFIGAFHHDPPALGDLIRILGTSPFLSEILISTPGSFDAVRSDARQRRPPSVEGEFERLSDLSGSRVAETLKQLQRELLLRVAAFDILSGGRLQEVTKRLSTLADQIVDHGLRSALREQLASDGLDRAPGAFVVIAMGKLGGEELNYSSDIDLIYVYEPEDEESSDPHAFFRRLARRLTALLTDYSAEGYLYRVDLRLRPMGRGGNITHSLEQIRQYYNIWGVTFERFAMLKARPIAGNLALGRRFIETVDPYVYRRYLDFAALEEMYQHRLVHDRAMEDSEQDRNVKTGRGGIREVELFAQTLQLTYGARYPELKQRNTLAALDALRATSLITDAIHDTLKQAYVFLRTVEHRLQIVEGSQTHSLSSGDELAISARRLGFDNVAQMQAELDAHRASVHSVYAELFGRRDGSANFEARQFFRILSDELPEAEARDAMAAAGFKDPQAALEAVRALGQQATFTMAPTTSRNILANLLAVCAPQLVRCGRPETTLIRLEQLAEGTGGASQLGRSLLEDDVLRTALIDVLDSGEQLAQSLIQDPELLDSIAQPVTTIETLRRTFDVRLTAMERFDRAKRMDELRRFKRHEEFKVLVGWLASGSLDELEEGLTTLADYCASRTARWHAPVKIDDESASWAIVALGRLGGMELTVQSDLDLVIVYEDPDDPSDSTARWQHFVERFQSFLTQPTAEGVAYRIDTRLRPEGTKGPLAIPMPAFLRYLGERAERWERLAWTRAQILVGSSKLAQRIMHAADEFVYGPWDPTLPAYMHSVRLRQERELVKQGAARLEFKVGSGGLADIDFVVQLVQIREGSSRREFRVPGTRRLLAAAPETRYITPEEFALLLGAHRFLTLFETFARLDAATNVTWVASDGPALGPLGKRMGFEDPSGERLLSAYQETTSRVRTIYTRVFERLSQE
jgi:[glutamine synthetase] adenylyltransferase / [glutamine synthetase]-adenylyl-L-tyrosine phosphorylase